jgi:hypothetical protein
VRACLLTSCAALAVLGAAPTARAERGELQLAPTLGVATWDTRLPAGGSVSRLAVVGGLELGYAVSDFWQIALTTRGGPALLGDPRVELGFLASLEMRYVIDAVTWVPYLCGGAGVLVRSLGPDAYAGGQGPAADLVLHLGLGVDYRPARAFSIGAAIRYHLAVTDLVRTSVGPLDAAFRVAVFFD